MCWSPSKSSTKNFYIRCYTCFYRDSDLWDNVLCFVARFPWLRDHGLNKFAIVFKLFVFTASVDFLRTSGICPLRYRNYLCFAILIIAINFIVMKRTYFVEVVIFLV